MSATPRTDAVVERDMSENNLTAHNNILDQARALERELAALSAPARELLHLYDWRPALAELEKNPAADPKEVKRLLREYGERKKAGWIALRAALKPLSEGDKI